MANELQDLLALTRQQRSHGASVSANTIYLATIVALSTLGTGAIVLLLIMLPDRDNTATIATILGFLVPIVSALLALMINSTHGIVNSRMDEFQALLIQRSELATVAARAEGVSAGQKAGREASDTRTDDLASKTAANTPNVAVPLADDGVVKVDIVKIPEK